MSGLQSAVFFGLVTGFAEVCLVYGRRLLAGRQMFHSQQIVWMAPAANVLLFLPLGVALVILARWWRRAGSVEVTCGALATFGVLALTLNASVIHPLAKLTLGAGAGVQTMRSARKRPEAWVRLQRRGSTWGIAAVLLVALGMNGWKAGKERWLVANLPEASSGARNVVLLILDTVRARSLGLYGRDRDTSPYLDQLAREGVKFERPFATAPWTLPSHVSLFTGRYPHETSADWLTPLDQSDPTLATVFSSHGYATGGFSGNLFYATWETGLDRGFQRFDDYVVSIPQVLISSALGRKVMRNLRLRRLLGFYDNFNRKSAAEVNEQFFRWVDRRSGTRPFFAFLNYFDAHEAYFPPEPFASRFGDPSERRMESIRFHQRLGEAYRFAKNNTTPREKQAELDAYEGAIAYADNELGRLIAGLEERGLMDETLFVVTADHGEQFGEHGLWEHSNSVFQPVVGVPLVIVDPTSVPRGLSVSEPVTLRDVPATILDLTGATADEVPGFSLRRHWSGAYDGGERSPVMAHVSAGIRRSPDTDISALVKDPHKLVWYHGVRTQLFDLSSDPAELVDLSGRPEYEELVQEMLTELQAMIRTSDSDDGRAPPKR